MNNHKTFSTRWRLSLLFFFLLSSIVSSVYAETAVNKNWSKPTALASTTLNVIGNNTSTQELPVIGKYGFSKIITNKNDKSFAVWTQYHSANAYMKHTHWSAYFDGKNWTNPVRIKGYKPTENGATPEIIFDGNGNILAAWTESSDAQVSSQEIIFTSRFDVQNLDWDNPIQLQYDNGQSIYDLKLTSRNNGMIHIVWEYINDDYSNSIWKSVFNGSSWSNPTLFIERGSSYLRDLAFSKNNNDIIGWYYDVSYEGSDFFIRVSANHFNGNDWNPKRLSTDTTLMANSPKIAFDNNGNAITVWTDENTNGTIQIVASHFNHSSRSWSSPVPISEGERPRAAQIVINNNGNAIVIWEDRNINGSILWANHFNGSNWGTPVPIESITNTFYEPSYKVVLDDNNHAHVVWVKNIDGNLNVWANYFDGSRWGIAKPIEKTEKEVNFSSGLKREFESGPVSLDITIDSNGNAHALWERSVSMWERESYFVPWEKTKIKTIWTSQLKASPPIAIQQAFVYTPFGGLVVITGANFMEYNEMTNKLVNQDGNSPLAIYVWKGDMVVALFRNIPESVTMTNPNGTKTIPLVKYF